MIVPCFMCGNPYERKRISGHFCRECKEGRRKRKNAENMARRREELREALPRAVRDPAPSLYQKIPKIAEQEARQKVGLSDDRMPEGSQSPYGADDGRSTFDKAFGEYLDTLGAHSEIDRWWIDHPHWNIGLYSGA